MIYFFFPQSPPKKKKFFSKTISSRIFSLFLDERLRFPTGFPPLVNHHQGIPRYLPRPFQPVAENAPKEEGGRGRGPMEPGGASEDYLVAKAN